MDGEKRRDSDGRGSRRRRAPANLLTTTSRKALCFRIHGVVGPERKTLRTRSPRRSGPAAFPSSSRPGGSSSRPALVPSVAKNELPTVIRRGKRHSASQINEFGLLVLLIGGTIRPMRTLLLAAYVAGICMTVNAATPKMITVTVRNGVAYSSATELE